MSKNISVEDFEKMNQRVQSKRRLTNEEVIENNAKQQSVFERTKGTSKKEPKKRNLKHEENLQLLVCNYIRAKYPDVIFTCDLSSGMKLSMGQAVRAKKMKSSRGLPDLMIFKQLKAKWGLFIELKRTGTKLMLKDGITLVADEHIREQSVILSRLRSEGYEAVFAVGFEEATKIIDNYLKG